LPELPEVETIRSRLAPSVTGRRFERVQILDPRLTRPEPSAAIAELLEGERVQSLGRRGKYLIFEFESGRHLLVHLRMTGSFRHVLPGASGGDSHRRAVVTLDDGSDVVYNDTRRFGTWELLEPGEIGERWDGRLGEEPFGRGFTPKRFATSLQGRRAPIKAALLDQRVVAGIGNIYADEALWRARIHPHRPAGSLSGVEVTRLRTAVRRALELGIDRQGATLRDYRDPSGRSGWMQNEFRVYGREGERCPRCGTPIAKTRAAGRGTWYCPTCQILPDEEELPGMPEGVTS
jgi:formamidopyrimidine-DNA glycosylase